MLEDLKLILGISPEDIELDGKLALIISLATARLKALLGGIEPPVCLGHIVLEAAVSRFNRIGSEGLSSHAVEGESLSFTESDFDGFAQEIQAFLGTQAGGGKGRVRFL